MNDAMPIDACRARSVALLHANLAEEGILAGAETGLRTLAAPG